MNKTEAYKIVFDDLVECNLFNGIYDAKNGNESFMHGICTVMEYIAAGISEECSDSFSDHFLNNVIKSKNKIQ